MFPFSFRRVPQIWRSQSGCKYTSIHSILLSRSPFSSSAAAHGSAAAHFQAFRPFSAISARFTGRECMSEFRLQLASLCVLFSEEDASSQWRQRCGSRRGPGLCRGGRPPWHPGRQHSRPECERHWQWQWQHQSTAPIEATTTSVCSAAAPSPLDAGIEAAVALWWH